MQNDIVRPPQQPAAPPAQQPQPAPQSQQVVVQNPQRPQPAQQPPVNNPTTQPPEQQPHEQQPSEPSNPETPQLSTAQKVNKSNTPKFIILTAVVAFIALAGVAIFAGMQQKDPVINKVNDSAAPSSAASPAAGSASMDSTIQEANGLPDDSTDPTNDLSDQALGL